MNEKFSTWLNQILTEYEWSQSELARRAGLSSAQVSDVIGERTEPGLKFYQGISKALNIPITTILQKAGILPPNAHEDHYLTELQHLVYQLSPEARNEILSYIRFRISQENVIPSTLIPTPNELEQIILAHLQGMDRDFQQTVLKTIRVWRMYEELKHSKNS